MKKVLFVDDDASILAAFSRQFRKKFPIETAAGPELGLDLLGHNPEIAVVVADMKMPVMSGVDFLKRVRERYPEVVRLMLTGNTDLDTALRAVNEGHVFRFLVKPAPADQLENAVNEALRQYQLVHAERELLEKTVSGSVRVLTEVLDIAAPEAFGRSERLRGRVLELGRALRVPDLWEAEVAAMLCQLGAMTLPRRLLRRSRAGGETTSIERQMIDAIPFVGANLIRNIPRLEGVARAVLYQRKNFDGSGTPCDHISGDRIPIGARLLKVAVELEEHEWSGLSTATALERMGRTTGLYDPGVLKTATELFASHPENNIAPLHAGRLRVFDVREGHRLVSEVRSHEGEVLAPAGRVVTPTVLELLRNAATASTIDEFIEVHA